MICPNCNSDKVSLWPWFDGGFKGIRCNECGREYWSDIVSTKVWEEEKKLHEILLAQWDFPLDGCANIDDLPPNPIGMTLREAMDYLGDTDWDIDTGMTKITKPMSNQKGLIALVFADDKREKVVSFNVTRYENKSKP